MCAFSRKQRPPTVMEELFCGDQVKITTNPSSRLAPVLVINCRNYDEGACEKVCCWDIRKIVSAI